MPALLKQIDDFITQKIAPSVVSHGGRVEIMDLTDNRLKLGLSGACSTCSMDTLTKEGISEFVMNEFPDLEDCEVVDIDGDETVPPPLAQSIKSP